MWKYISEVPQVVDEKENEKKKNVKPPVIREDNDKEVMCEIGSWPRVFKT